MSMPPTTQSTALEQLAARVAAMEASAPKPRGPRPYYTQCPLAADLSPASLVARWDEDPAKRTPPALITECRNCGGRLKPDVELPKSTLEEARASVPTTLEVLKCKHCDRFGEAVVSVKPGSRSLTVPVPSRIVPCGRCGRDVAVAHDRTPEDDADDALRGWRWAGALCTPCFQAHRVGLAAPEDLPETPRPAEKLGPAERFDKLIDGRGIEPARHERVTEDRTPRKRGTL